MKLESISEGSILCCINDRGTTAIKRKHLYRVRGKSTFGLHLSAFPTDEQVQGCFTADRFTEVGDASSCGESDAIVVSAADLFDVLVKAARSRRVSQRAAFTWASCMVASLRNRSLQPARLKGPGE